MHYRFASLLSKELSTILNKKNSECDFIVCEKNVPVMLIQVCLTLNTENQRREVAGIQGAMKFFKMDKGVIVTLNQTDRMRIEEGWIEIIPAYEIGKRI